MMPTSSGLENQGVLLVMRSISDTRSLDWALDDLVGLLEAGDIDAVGQLPDQLVEQMHRQIAIGLQVFDGLLARLQRRDFRLFDGGDFNGHCPGFRRAGSCSFAADR